MREFFKPWRQKIGVVTLVMACALMGGWIRSYSRYDILSWGIGSTPDDVLNRGVQCVNFKSGNGYIGYRLDPVLLTRRPAWDGCKMSETQFGPEFLSPRDSIISYGSIVIPLTLLSAWLLLRRPRPAKPQAEQSP